MAQLLAGDELPAVEFQWQNYTLTLTGSTTNPTLGNSTVISRYRENGLTVDVDITIVVGNSGFNAGSGTWIFSIPATMRDFRQGVGTCYILDSGTADRFGFTVKGESGGNTITVGGGTTQVAHNQPQAWAVNDQIRIRFSYERAT